MRPHWRHLANTIELVLPLAHPSPQCKRQIDRFSHFRTAHCRVSSSMSFPLISAHLHVGSGPHLIHASLGPLKSITQMASRSVQPFLHRWPHSVPILYNGTPLLHSNLPLPIGDLDPHLTYGSLGPPKSSTQTASRSVQLVLHGSLVTDRPTGHTTRSVTIDHSVHILCWSKLLAQAGQRLTTWLVQNGILSTMQCSPTTLLMSTSGKCQT